MSQITKSIEIGKMFLENAKSSLINSGAIIVPDKNPYIFSKLKMSEITISLYTSGKAVLQGKNEKAMHNVQCIIDNGGGDEMNTDLSGREGQKSPVLRSSSATDGEKVKGQISGVIFVEGMVGADEAGKGEYFGPLVTGACFVPKIYAEELIKAGICDSKKIKDSKIFEFESLIKQRCIWSVNIVNNSLFNKQMKETGNISEVLALAHVKSINDIINNAQCTLENERPGEKERITQVLIDKFTKIESRIHNKFDLKIPVIMEEKGEKYLAVACASVLARSGYLNAMALIEKKYGKLMKGYNGLRSFVADFIANNGIEAWEEIAKTSYSMGK